MSEDEFQKARRSEARIVTMTSPGHTLTQTFGEAEADSLVEKESRLNRILGSPRAIMVLVPLIVLALGATLTLIGQVALGATSRTMARNRFVSHTTSLARGLEETLGQAEPLLDELARIAVAAEPLEQPKAALDKEHTKKSRRILHQYEHEELTPVALEMRDLLVGRPGITQAYIAFPNGTFLSADPAGPRAVGIQVTQDGRSASYQVKGQSVDRISTRKSNYDPRTRDWYKLAERKRVRVWSAPYTFFFNQHTGVTRSFPLYRDEQKTDLLAVVGVDFDVDALTAFMAGSETAGDRVHSVVFTLGGIILAYPRGAQKLAALQRKKRVPTHEAVADPELSALIDEVKRGSRGNPDLLEFQHDKHRMLASVQRLGSGGPDWYVATFSPERTVLKELYEHRKSSLIVGLFSLLVAVALAWFLARRLYSIRRAAHLAQAAALEARGQVRDLGSYRLVSRIGEGGMGEVWRATHRLLARHAAIKLIKPSHASAERKAEQRERFRREAQAIAGLRSRNTIALYDYGITHDGTLFYVMELLDGIDLNSLVSIHGPQNPERVRRILIQACNSLAEAHQAQLVHRDIKPANLFLCREADEVDILKVLDFGLVFQAETLDEPESDADADGPSDTPGFQPPAAPADDKTPQEAPPTQTVSAPVDEGRITRADHQLGTPAFMSPEQALASGTDGRSDLYSLACVAWWLLCAQAPFHAETAVALMLKHIEEPLPDLESQCPHELQPGFVELIRSCLEKSPLDRPQSAQELGAALKALGPQTSDWSEEVAQAWWREHLSIPPESEPLLSLPPLRDAEVLPPEAV